MSNRFEILKTKDGFMCFDNYFDDYLYDEYGNNCFDSYLIISNLIKLAQEIESV